MRKLLILGAGTAGTMMANKMDQHLSKDEWRITIVDQEETHIYQPGLLFIPFDIYTRNDVIKAKRDYIPKDVELVMSGIDVIEPENNRVKLTNNQVLSYDYLIIATGTRTQPDETEGLAPVRAHNRTRPRAWRATAGIKTFLISIRCTARTEGLAGDGWYKNIFDFYTLHGACELQKFLRHWEGGRLVLNIVEMPIKCPVAPLEFLFLADWYFTEKGIRDSFPC